MFDPQADLYDPLYEELGTEAVVTIGEATFDLTVIDHSASAKLWAEERGLRTVRFLASVRQAELDLTVNALTREDLEGATIALNSKSFTIRSTYVEPGPAGEVEGELYLILVEGITS